MTNELVRRRMLDIRPSALRLLIDAVHSKKPVTGSTHEFYRYPARFSPQFAEAVIETFSAPGQVVLDPFMGGATTLVEARTLGRIGVGLDVNEFSCFFALPKTTTLSTSCEDSFQPWIQ